MDIHINTTGPVTVVELVGRFDSEASVMVSDRLLPLAQQGGRVVLDMSRVDYMSSAGLRVLLLIYRKVEETAGAVMLAGLQDRIRDVMEMTGFLGFFTEVGTTEEGIEALSSY